MKKNDNIILIISIIIIIAVGGALLFSAISNDNNVSKNRSNSNNINKSYNNLTLANDSGNYDGSGIVKLIDSGLTTGDYVYLDVETDNDTLELAISVMYQDNIKEKDNIYFNYTGGYMSDGVGNYRLVEPVDSNGNYI